MDLLPRLSLFQLSVFSWQMLRRQRSFSSWLQVQTYVRPFVRTLTTTEVNTLKVFCVWNICMDLLDCIDLVRPQRGINSVIRSIYWLGYLSETTNDIPSNTYLEWLRYSTWSVVSTLSVRLTLTIIRLPRIFLDHLTFAGRYEFWISTTTSKSRRTSVPRESGCVFRFGDEGCLLLCSVLADNRNITRLSLTYCDLGVVCGNPLGRLLVQTAIAWVQHRFDL